MSRNASLIGASPAAAVLDPDDEILLAVKTPLTGRAIVALASGHQTLRQSVAALRDRVNVRNADTRRVLDQVERELSAPVHHYLVAQPNGAIVNTPPDTPLRTLAVPREVRTTKGLKSIPTVAIEVQAYAPVG